MRSRKRIRKSVGRKSLFQRLTHRYRMSLVNEDEQKETLSIRISKLNFLVFVFSAVFIGLLLGYAVRDKRSRLVPVDKDYMLRQTIIDDALRIDSLAGVVDLQNRYITNIQDIIAGRISLDTVFSIDSLALQRSVQLMEQTGREEAFVAQFEEAERYNITSQSVPMQDLQAVTIFRPTLGLVSRSFNAQEAHYGVDIAASPYQSVVAVLEGTVMLGSFTAESGYTICILHPGELVSVYKHCESLLRKSGDRVRQGEVVALVGRGVDEDTSDSHLHFELWYQGQPLDPEKYILLQ